jgi:hypothetical protein
MASFVGGVYTSGWTIEGESQSPDPGDHVDDFGNTPIGGWKRPWHPMMPKTPEYGYEPTPETAQPRPSLSPYRHGFQMGPGEEQEPTWLKPAPMQDQGKTMWDRLTPGDSKSPQEMLEDLLPGGLTTLPGTILPIPKGIVPDVTKPIDDLLGGILPLMLIMTMTKER